VTRLRYNLYTALLDRLHIACAPFLPGNTLRMLDRAIRASSARMAKLSPRDDPEYKKSVIDEEYAVIENLLGVSFVVSQIVIANIASRVMALSEHHARSNPGTVVPGLSKNRQQLYHFKSTTVARTPHTQIEVINAFANYYKHRDDWPLLWNPNTMTGPSMPTALVVSAVGASANDSGNMRHGLKVLLGRDDYSNSSAIANIVLTWGTQLHDHYRRELKALRLVQ